MQTLSVGEKGIEYLLLCLKEYAGGCVFLLLYALCLLCLLIEGKRLYKRVFLPQAFMLLLTVFNPLFPLLLNRIFDVNNEYYRFFWIAPVVIICSLIFTELTFSARGIGRGLMAVFFILLIVGGGSFLYRDGYILSPNIYKMPTEIPEVSEMIHEDADGRYEGDYYPRAIFEFDYEMCMRQYDASIMLSCDRETYLEAIQAPITNEMIVSEENYAYRLLSVMVQDNLLPPSEFLKGLEKTGTEYVCVSSANERLCDYMEESCSLRKVGSTENHTLYHYELEETEPFYLPDYSEVWMNY